MADFKLSLTYSIRFLCSHFVLERCLCLPMWPLLWLTAHQISFYPPHESVTFVTGTCLFSQALITKVVPCFACQIYLTVYSVQPIRSETVKWSAWGPTYLLASILDFKSLLKTHLETVLLVAFCVLLFLFICHFFLFPSFIIIRLKYKTIISSSSSSSRQVIIVLLVVVLALLSVIKVK